MYDNVTRMIVDVGFNRLPDSAKNGKLIYLKGRIEVNEPLTEPEYGVTIAAVKLKRRVQMYQWVEVQEEKSLWWGYDVDTYSPVVYTTAWRDRLVDSTLFAKPFGHANPKAFPLESSVSVSETVRVGGYTLSDELKDHFTTFTLLTSDQRPERRDIKMHSGLYYHSFDVWNPEVGDTRVQLSYAGASDSMSSVSVSETVRVGGYTLSDELKDHFTTFTLLTSDQRPERRDIKMHSGLYYHSFDVWNPEVGDTRVQLSYAGASDSMVTILAEQAGTTLRPFVVEGKDLTAVMEGEQPLTDILAIKFPSSGVWLIRIPACFAVYCGYSTLSFIAGKRSRLLQAFVNNNKSLLCQILSAATFFIVMGITWFSYSPTLGSVNLLTAAILILYTFSKGYSLYYYFNR